MPGTIELVLIIATIAALLASGLWTELRFASFEKLPAHYDFRGEPTRYSSRSVMAWLLPCVFSIMLVVVTVAMSAIPEEVRNGDPLGGVIVCCATFLVAQALILWLHTRWAQRQG